MDKYDVQSSLENCVAHHNVMVVGAAFADNGLTMIVTCVECGISYTTKSTNTTISKDKVFTVYTTCEDEVVINNTIKKRLPHGSGVDADWSIIEVDEVNKTTTLKNSYHAMNQNGMYVGWVDFTFKFDNNGELVNIIVDEEQQKALEADDDVYLNDLKDYLWQTFDCLN